MSLILYESLTKVNQWNQAYPVGTKVEVLLDSGERKETVTTSEAWMLGKSRTHPGHTPVIMLKDVRGCYLIDRVRAI
jgi:hypothetical protein